MGVRQVAFHLCRDFLFDENKSIDGFNLFCMNHHLVATKARCRLIGLADTSPAELWSESGALAIEGADAGLIVPDYIVETVPDLEPKTAAEWGAGAILGTFSSGEGRRAWCWRCVSSDAIRGS